MTEPNIWKMIEVIEKMNEKIELYVQNMESLMDAVSEYGKWSNTVTESLVSLQNQINYLKNKKDAV